MTQQVHIEYIVMCTVVSLKWINVTGDVWRTPLHLNMVNEGDLILILSIIYTFIWGFQSINPTLHYTNISGKKGNPNHTSSPEIASCTLHNRWMGQYVQGHSGDVIPNAGKHMCLLLSNNIGIDN